jgi:hypothetical protein
MPGDVRDESGDESEFGLGEGMIDPISRRDRAIPLHQELWEIAARPQTVDGAVEVPPVEEVVVPRLLPGEEESDRG